MESKKKAIYVHGLWSGAASTTIDIVRKVFLDYEWTPVEVNEDPVDSDNTINQAIAESREKGIRGKETTPFLLARIKDITGGDSLASNIQLVLNNARLAALTAALL